jgi:hypothetical protein
MLSCCNAHEIRTPNLGPHYVIHSADLFRPIIEGPLPTMKSIAQVE